MRRCKCKNPKPKRIGNVDICKKCGKLIYKIKKVRRKKK